MNKRNGISFRWKLVLWITTMAVGATAITAFLIYRGTQQMVIEVMGDRLLDISRTGLHHFDSKDYETIRNLKTEINDSLIYNRDNVPEMEGGEALLAVSEAKSDELMKDEGFLRLVGKLRDIKSGTVAIREENGKTVTGQPSVKYAYMLIEVPWSADHNYIAYVADADYNAPGNENPVGNLYRNQQESFFQAFNGQASADREFLVDEWGLLLSAAVPVTDENGDIIAIMGLDLDYNATGNANKLKELYYICIASVAASLIISLLLSYFFGTLVARPVGKLQEGALKVADRDFSTHVDVKSNDELGTLADTFNGMVEEIREYSDYLQKLNLAYYRFVPREFLEHLGQESVIDIKLGDQVQKEMTVLFSDIRSFTTISEGLSPADNFNFLNSYLKRVGPMIRRHHGFIDKYIGDAVMALFPVGASDAVNAAVSMRKELAEFNTHREGKGFPPIDIGIGLHTGTLMLGTIGEEERMESTVIADAVNLASRLESLTKKLGASIIVSEDTLNHSKMDAEFSTRFLGKVKVKGKTIPILIYEVFDGDPESIYTKKLGTKNTFEEGVNLYNQAQFAEAARLFSEIVSRNEADLAASMYMERSVKYRDIVDNQEAGVIH